MSRADPGQELIASFDIGSTAAKGVLVARDRGVVAERSVAYPTHYGPEGQVEQQPDDWWAAASQLARGFWAEGWDAAGVRAIALTGQMQDLILLDGSLRPLGPAILYSDARAGAESRSLRAALAARGIEEDRTRYLDATSPLAKLLWLRRHQPEVLDGCRHTLFGAADYVLARLAGVVAGDATTAATTGFYDLQAKRWHHEWLEMLDLPATWLPPLLHRMRACGGVTAEVARLAGFRPGTPVYPGMGDAAAATLSAGLVAPGDAYLYLGTTAWAATLQLAPGPEHHGLRYLPSAGGEELTIAIAPLLNAGSAQQWIMALLGFAAAERPPDYEGFERLLVATPDRSEGVLFLPYLNGERCPVREDRAMGTFAGLGARSGAGQLGWAVLEGICFALRQVLETLGGGGDSLRMLGGMARSPLLRQLVAEICGLIVRAPRLPEAAGALAAAMPAAVDIGWFATPAEALSRWFPAQEPGSIPTMPFPPRSEHYRAAYGHYCHLYPLISQLPQ